MDSTFTVRSFYFVAVTLTALLQAVTARGMAPADAPLSGPALEAIVAGVALYPDPIIERILLAAQSPESIHAAASSLPANASSRPNGGRQDSMQLAAAQRLAPTLAPHELAAAKQAIADLSAYPDVIRSLDQHLTLTVRLGLAARQQLADVWAAIDRVRAKYEAYAEGMSGTSEPQVAAQGNTSGGQGAVMLAAPYGAFMAGLLADNVVGELAATTTYAARPGTTGVAAAGATTQGNTTYFGAAAAGTTTTPAGKSTSQAGAVTGSATKTESGGTLTKQSAGGIVNNNTGDYAAGTRSTAATVDKNADGSVSYSRDAATKTRSSYGQTDVNRSSQATITGNGNGSYQSTTEIESSRGDATVETNAQQGQVTTTIETEQGTKTLTAGDGEIQNKPASSTTGNTSAKGAASQSASTRTSKPSTRQPQTTSQTTRPPSSNKYSQVSRQQMQVAQNAHAQSWSQVSNQTAARNNTPSPKNMGRPPATGFSQPNVPRSPATPSRNSPSPKGGPGGGGGGKRKR